MLAEIASAVPGLDAAGLLQRRDIENCVLALQIVVCVLAEPCAEPFGEAGLNGSIVRPPILVEDGVVGLDCGRKAGYALLKLRHQLQPGRLAARPTLEVDGFLERW